VGFLQYMEVDPQWIKAKFGIEVIKAKAQGGAPANFQ
jgi:hypothetical protein